MKSRISDYQLVAKPGIVAANLVSAAGGFLLASRRDVNGHLLRLILAGVGLMVASGCVLNNCIDRHVDRRMCRTRNRVIVRGDMSPGVAYFYAGVLGLFGMLLIGAIANGLCTTVVLAGFTAYVGLYSLGLKSRSVHALLVGSLAGAAPPLAGYCAVTNRFDTGALILLTLFCVWQIPHARAITVSRLEDFAKAGIPVLPVMRGIPVATRHMQIAVTAFTAVALMPRRLHWFQFCGRGGHGEHLLADPGLSGLAHRRQPPVGQAIFLFSILSISVLSLMMAIDFVPRESASRLLTATP